MGYDIIFIDEKDDAIMLGIDIGKGQDNQPEPGGFAQRALVHIGVAIG